MDVMFSRVFGLQAARPGGGAALHRNIIIKCKVLSLHIYRSIEKAKPVAVVPTLH